MISEALIRSQVQKIDFVMVDALYNEVAGLAGALNIQISKNGGPLVPATGAQGEIGSGGYYYDLTAAETNTIGPLYVKVTAPGCVQQNLEYVVEQRNGGACPFTYTLTDTVSLLPITGAEVWFCTDLACTNVVWYGTTDAFGVARDSSSALPMLDPGTYYLKRHKPGYSFAVVDTEVVSCDLTVVAEDSGPLGLDGVYSDVTLGGSVNRAYFNGVDSQVSFYTPGFAAAFDPDECTIIIRGEVKYVSTYTDGFLHSLISIYSAPFGYDLVIGIPVAGSAVELRYDIPVPPFTLSRTVATTQLGWRTYGARVSNLAGNMFFDIDGVQQGASLGVPLWSNPVGANYCLVGQTNWLGWAADLIVSLNGVVATSPQMLAIHNALIANTLTTAALDAIFGVGNYIWYKLDESP